MIRATIAGNSPGSTSTTSSTTSSDGASSIRTDDMLAEASSRPLRFLPCGESAMIVECADLDAALEWYAAIDTAAFDGVTTVLPAARTVYVAFDPLLAATNVRDFRSILQSKIANLHGGVPKTRDSRVVEIPVVYDGEDLGNVAKLLGISTEQVVARHAGHPWKVAFGGFAPGFDYLVGGDPIFDVPRRKAPRLAVPAGSVGLAGTFSGVYPRASSGGWQLIGRTSVPMWNDAMNPPALLRPGDTVRFTPARAEATTQGVLRQDTPHNASERLHHTAPTMHVAGSTMHATGTTPDAPALEAVNPGILATFQDEGRHAPEMGVTGSGAADPRAFHLANELVGNPTHTPVIELTGGNASFTAHGDLTIAVTGAPAPVTIISASNPLHQSGSALSAPTGSAPHNPNTPFFTPAGGDSRRTPGGGDRKHAARTPEPAFPITRQEAFLLRDGETVAIGAPTAGLRDYIAVRGGFAVPTILDSASTDTMSGIGPAPLRPGNFAPINPLPEGATARRSLTIGLPQPWPDDLPRAAATNTTNITELAVTLGPRDDWFTEAGIATFLGTTWTVTAQSNRVGLRLAAAVSAASASPDSMPAGASATPATPAATPYSPVIERRDPHAELKSEATIPGSIEVPGNGLPLIFLRDQPVTGGYPVIAVLTTAALTTAGQLPPGARIRFTLHERTA